MVFRKRDRVLIMGLGLHGGGVGVANYFLKQGCKVLITDLKKRKELRESLNKINKSGKVKYVFGKHRYRDFRRASVIIKNPAVRPDSPYLEYARSRGIRIDSDVGIFLDEVLKKTENIIGITGTKGKSTTASLIYKSISNVKPNAILAGNIGVSVLSLIDRIKKNTWVILELSSFQLGSIREKKYSPHIAVFTNFMEDHLNYYLNMNDYFRDKELIYRYQKPGDVLVVKRDPYLLKKIEPASGVRLLSFGIEQEFEGEGVYVKSNDGIGSITKKIGTVGYIGNEMKFYSGGMKGEVFFKGKGVDLKVLSLEKIKFTGIHNIYNILAAVAVCLAIGLKPDFIQRAFEEYTPLAHRLEIIHERPGFRIINDTAATIPEAAISAIRSVERPITLIAGGYDKGLNLEDFVKTVNEEVETLVLLKGSGTSRMLEMGIAREYWLFDDFMKAIEFALKKSEGRGTVILSPGFASFGMFKNEFHRGDEFKRIVTEMLSKGIV